MSRGLVFSHDYNLVTACWLMETGVLGQDCDVLLIGGTPELASRLEETGYFKRVFQPLDHDSAGMPLYRRDQAIDAALRNPGRLFRQKSRYVDLLSPTRFYGPDAREWNKCYVTSVCFESLPPQLKWMLWKRAGLSLWEHSLFYSVKGAKIHGLQSFYFAEAQSLWFELHGILHPRDQLSEFVVSCPELIPKECRERVTVKVMPKIDRSNRSFVRAMNDVFGTDGADEHLPSIVFFPISIGSLQRFQSMEQRFLDQAAAILGKNVISVKEHPSTIYENKIPWRGVNLFRNAALPWELQILNHGGWDRRLLISSYCTNALLTAKACFDEEPFVLNFCRLLPEVNQGAGLFHLELAEDVGRLYRNPEKYCIPGTWDEAWDFLRAFEMVDDN